MEEMKDLTIVIYEKKDGEFIELQRFDGVNAYSIHFGMGETINHHYLANNLFLLLTENLLRRVNLGNLNQTFVEGSKN